MRVPLLDLTAQFATLRDEVMAAVERVMTSQFFILGPEVEALENEVAAYCGADYAVGVASGSDALLLSLMALGAGPGDAVITTPYTFFATAGSIHLAGASPVFVDIEPDTYNIAPEHIRAYLERDCTARDGALIDRPTGKAVRGIIPVHLSGQSAEMDAIMETARHYGLWVVEDAAQSIGARYKERKAGAIGTTGCFSFFPTKNLGGAGDGGMVITNDEDIADKLRILRVHGGHPKHYYKVVGTNSRLDALQAAVLRVKLRHLDGWSAARARNAAVYDAAFADVPGLATPRVRSCSPSIYNQYVLRIEGAEGRRDRLLEHLREKEIGCDTYYPLPVHLQESFKHLGYTEGDLPEAERAARQTLAIPVYPELTREMIDYVITVITAFMAA